MYLATLSKFATVCCLIIDWKLLWSASQEKAQNSGLEIVPDHQFSTRLIRDVENVLWCAVICICQTKSMYTACVFVYVSSIALVNACSASVRIALGSTMIPNSLHVLVIDFKSGTHESVRQDIYFVEIGTSDEVEHLYTIFVRPISTIHLNNRGCSRLP